MAKIKIRLITVTKCSPKGREPYTRFDYIPLEVSRKSQNIKGNVVSAFFINGHGVFDNIPESILETDMIANIEYEPSPTDPVRMRPVMKSLETKSGTINLV